MPLAEALLDESRVVRGWSGLTPAIVADVLKLPLEPGGRAALELDVARTGGVIPFHPRTAAMLWCYTPEAALRAPVRAFVRAWDAEPSGAG